MLYLVPVQESKTVSGVEEVQQVGLC